MIYLAVLFRRFRLAEEAEIYAAVGAVFDETRHVLERVVLAVLENEYAAGLQHSALQYHPGQQRQFGKGVRRVGKDEVELLTTALNEAEHVAAQWYALVSAKLLEALADECVVVAVGLNAYDRGASARQQFKRYAAGARKQVERNSPVKVYVAVKHVENVFLCEVRSRPRLERLWYFKVTSLIYSGYYSHLFN